MQQIPTGFIFLISFTMGSIAYYIAKKKKEEPKASLPAPVANKIWYYLSEDMTQSGPISTHALKQAWKDGTVTDTTYIWNEDLDDWKQLGTIQHKLDSPLEEILSKTTS